MFQKLKNIVQALIANSIRKDIDRVVSNPKSGVADLSDPLIEASLLMANQNLRSAFRQLDSLSEVTLLMRLRDHECAKAIRTYFWEAGVDPTTVEQVNSTCITYRGWTKLGSSVALSVYFADEAQEKPCFGIEIALSVVETPEHERVFEYLLKLNSRLSFPLKLGLTDDGIVLLELHARCDKIEKDFFCRLVELSPDIADLVLRSLSEDYGMRSYRDVVADLSGPAGVKQNLH